MKKMGELSRRDPEISAVLKMQEVKFSKTLQLGASDTIVSRAVLEAESYLGIDKYAGGYPSRRFYGGCQEIDTVEKIAINRAKSLFGAGHANVQPYSGSLANMAVYFTLLKHGDTILSMGLRHGGRLTHGSPANFSGKFYNVVTYGVNKETEIIDFAELLEIAKKERPKLIVAGASTYPRALHFKIFKKVADEVNAYLLADMANIAGLVAADLHTSPIPFSDFTTCTTHRTLKGPKGGIILCGKKYAEEIDRMVYPGIQSGASAQRLAGEAVALGEAQKPSFRKFQIQMVKNARLLGKELRARGFRLVAGGTDTHIVLLDLKKKGITGVDAEKILEKAGIVVNRNCIPYDTLPPSVTSGIRLGTSVITARGMKETDMKAVSGFINDALTAGSNRKELSKVEKKVQDFCSSFPSYIM